MGFERVCALGDVPFDEAHPATVGGIDVAIARDGEEVFALRDQCSHAAVPLSQGEVADRQIECYLHGSCFDLSSGKPTGLPATEPVATFPTEIRDVEGTPVVYVDVTTTLNGVTPS